MNNYELRIGKIKGVLMTGDKASSKLDLIDMICRNIR